MIEEKEKLKDELKNNELFKRDVKNILSHATPYVPYNWVSMRSDLYRKTYFEK